MFPEEKARAQIDRMLREAGWSVVSRAEYNPSQAAVAVCEGILQGKHEADYLLFLDGKAIGVLEAKAAHIPLSDRVRQQAEQYTRQLLDWCPAWQRPLPFVFLSNGRELLFADLREKQAKYQAIPSMLSPRKLMRLAGIDSYFAGLTRLKVKALDLDIHGKLTKQDPADEPASELLKRIKAEKETLIKAKKIKTPKEESTIYRKENGSFYERKGKTETCIDDEIPFDIPNSWEWVRGFQCLAPMTSILPSGDTFKYIDIKAIDNKNNVINDVKILSTNDAPSRAVRSLSAGDTLFSMVRPYLRNIAFVNEKNKDCIASSGFYVCKPHKTLYIDKFFFFLMLSPFIVSTLNKYMKGHNSPSISTKDIENQLFPLPSINSQMRIISMIEKLYNLI